MTRCWRGSSAIFFTYIINGQEIVHKGTAVCYGNTLFPCFSELLSQVFLICARDKRKWRKYQKQLKIQNEKKRVDSQSLKKPIKMFNISHPKIRQTQMSTSLVSIFTLVNDIGQQNLKSIHYKIQKNKLLHLSNCKQTIKIELRLKF